MFATFQGIISGTLDQVLPHMTYGSNFTIMTAPTLTKHTTTKLTERLPERRYLPELHGVRGLALLGVVLFHLFGNGRISGGIDIFLAVSGFLFHVMLLCDAPTETVQ